jgi:dihydrofolate reductase
MSLDGCYEGPGKDVMAGKDTLMFGSRILWNDLLADDLVDGLHLMIAPVVLGAGTPIFAGQPAGALRLSDSRTWTGSGIVHLRYETYSSNRRFL